jgi:site-specific DNA recombinase
VRTTVAVRAAIYARVSSDQQAERHTIDSQVEALVARAAADGHEIQAELCFLDDGQSGASLIRPALERLRDLAAMGAIDAVYVHAPDRLARSYAHQAVLIEEFARAGTEVVFLNRPIGQTPEDTLLLQLQGMFAEYERARIVERSRRGKRHLARAGVVSVLGRAPYGYRYVARHEAADGKARFEVVEEEAAVIRRMFQWVAQERVSLAAVGQRLFAASVPSPTGKARWRESMVSALLTNPAYAGQARFGKRATAPWQPPLRPPRGRAPIPKHPRRRVLAPVEQWISIPIPALIDTALFEATQEQLSENRRRYRQRKAGARYLLQGLLVCQSCGYALCGRWKASWRRSGQGYRYYRCTGTDSHRFAGQRQCDARPLPVEPLDAAVWAEVCRLLENPTCVADEYQRRLQAVRSGPRRPELETLERQLSKLRAGAGRLIDSYAEGVISKMEFEPRLAGLRQRIAELEAEAAVLHDTAEQARSLQLVIGKLEIFATMIRDRLDEADWTTKRDLIRTLVRRIEVNDQHVRVVFRVGLEPQRRPDPRQISHLYPSRGRSIRSRTGASMTPACASAGA